MFSDEQKAKLEAAGWTIGTVEDLEDIDLLRYWQDKPLPNIDPCHSDCNHQEND